MGTLSGLLHLTNFVAPALGVALLLALLSWGFRPGARMSSLAWAHARALFMWSVVGGLLVLFLGLIYFGRDGKMATYGAMVLVMGTLAFWHHRR